jgi:hypothetical protein
MTGAPDGGNGHVRPFRVTVAAPASEFVGSTVSRDSRLRVNPPFLHERGSEAAPPLNNGERRFEPEQVAPRKPCFQHLSTRDLLILRDAVE